MPLLTGLQRGLMTAPPRAAVRVRSQSYVGNKYHFPVKSAPGRVGFFSKTKKMPGRARLSVLPLCRGLGAEPLAQEEFRTNPRNLWNLKVSLAAFPP